MSSVRLTLLLHRFELVAIVLFATLLSGAALLVAERLDAIGYHVRCNEWDPVTGLQPPGCEALAQAFWAIDQDQATPVVALVTLFPYVAGLFLGAPLVAREIERGTTRLAWSLGPSRVGWFIARVAPILVVTVAASFVLGVAADRLAAARVPGLDVSHAFDGFGQRGVLIPVQAGVLMIGSMALGAIVGRQLPTVLLALVFGAAGVNGVSYLHGRATADEAVPVVMDEVALGSRWVGQLFRLPDGRLVDWAGLEAFDPASATRGYEGYPEVALVVPGERYREIEAREAAILSAITAVMFVGASVVVVHRRPG